MACSTPASCPWAHRSARNTEATQTVACGRSMRVLGRTCAVQLVGPSSRGLPLDVIQYVRGTGSGARALTAAARARMPPVAGQGAEP